MMQTIVVWVLKRLDKKNSMVYDKNNFKVRRAPKMELFNKNLPKYLESVKRHTKQLEHRSRLIDSYI